MTGNGDKLTAKTVHTYYNKIILQK